MKALCLRPMEVACLWMEIEHMELDPGYDSYDWAIMNIGGSAEQWDDISGDIQELCDLDPTERDIRITQTFYKIIDQLDTGASPESFNTVLLPIVPRFESEIRRRWESF